jgi:hypothetical protein
MIETRLLDPGNKSDLVQLRDILNHYLEDSQARPNQVWSEIAATNTIGRMLINFNVLFKDHIIISGAFNDGELEKIYIGEKISMYLQETSTPDGYPYWFTSLIYSKNKKIKNTHKELHDIATLVVREMERQRYYTFFTLIKCPAKGNKDPLKQIENNFPFSVMPRYYNVLEAIINPGDKVEDIKMKGHFFETVFTDSARNKHANKKLMLSSHHLKNEYRDFSKELGI